MFAPEKPMSICEWSEMPTRRRERRAEVDSAREGERNGRWEERKGPRTPSRCRTWRARAAVLIAWA